MPSSHFNENLLNHEALAVKHLESVSKLDEMELDMGWLGKIFGSKSHTPNNIAALSIVILLSIGLVITFVCLYKPATETGSLLKDSWSIITPLITLFGGYLFWR